MLSQAVTFIARRGVEVVVLNGGSSSDSGDISLELPEWLSPFRIFLFSLLLATYFIASTMMQYTFGHVIPTLLVIESPTEDITFEPLPTDDIDASLTKIPTLEAVKQRPITSSFRSSVRLLRSKGGFRGCFRGFSLYVVHGIAVQFISNILTSVPFLPRGLALILTMVLCAPLSLAWTLIVISEPSPKPWFRRLPSKAMCKKIALPTAIDAAASSLILVVPYIAALSMGLLETTPAKAHHPTTPSSTLVLPILATIILTLLLAIFIALPANIALTRVQASLLSDADETIIPFDRSFNGKFIPELVGGPGVLGMRDAWTTFDWAARVRLVKAYLKSLGLQVALFAVFMFVAGLPVFMVVGGDIRKGGSGAGEGGMHGALM